MSAHIPILSVDNLSSTIVNNLALFIPELLIVFAIVIGIVLDLIPRGKCYVKYFSLISLFIALIYEIITFGSDNAFIFYKMLKIISFLIYLKF